MVWGGYVHVPTGPRQVEYSDGAASSLITYIHHQLVMFMPCCGTLVGAATWWNLPTHWLAAVFTHPLLGIMSVCRSLVSVVAWWCGWSLLPVVPALWVPLYPRSCWPWLVLMTATPLPVEPLPPLATLVRTDYICHACILTLFDCCIMWTDAQVWFLGDLPDPDHAFIHLEWWKLEYLILTDNLFCLVFTDDITLQWSIMAFLGKGLLS